MHGVTVTSDRMTTAPATVANQPPTTPPESPVTNPVANPVEPKWFMPIMGANRRKQWIPFVLSRTAATPVASIKVKKDGKKPPHIFDGRLTAILGA